MDFSKQLTKSTWQAMKTYIKKAKKKITVFQRHEIHTRYM